MARKKTVLKKKKPGASRREGTSAVAGAAGGVAGGVAGGAGAVAKMPRAKIAGRKIAGRKIAGRKIAGRKIAGRKVAGRKVADPRVGEAVKNRMIYAGARVEKVTASRQAWVHQIVSGLKREYPEAHCYLNFETPFQLLIATILSAQCTDDRVNKVTPALFKRFPDARSMAKGTLPEIEKFIQTAGFFRMKAKSLSETSQTLVENYGGELPRELEKLTALRGVGRKTANVVLGNAFDIPGMVVDTHVGRLTRRMGMTTEEDPVKVEADLEKLVPREDWVVFSHLLIAHGRAICTSRRAKCEECFLSRFCEKRI